MRDACSPGGGPLGGAVGPPWGAKRWSKASSLALNLRLPFRATPSVELGQPGSSFRISWTHAETECILLFMHPHATFSTGTADRPSTLSPSCHRGIGSLRTEGAVGANSNRSRREGDFAARPCLVPKYQRLHLGMQTPLSNAVNFVINLHNHFFGETYFSMRWGPHFPPI